MGLSVWMKTILSTFWIATDLLSAKLTVVPLAEKEMNARGSEVAGGTYREKKKPQRKSCKRDMLRSPDAQGSWVRYWLSSHKQLVQSHEKPHLCRWDSLWEYVLWKAVVCHQVLRVKAMPCPMHFLISRGYLPICRLPQPYNSILSCFLLLHSGIPDLGTCLSYLSRYCKVRGKGMSMSQLGSPAWQLWQSHRAYAPVMAIRSFFLFTPWMEMESLSPESTTHMSFFFLSILSAFPAVYLFSSYSARSLHLLVLTDK